jgi:hypothetical protein
MGIFSEKACFKKLVLPEKPVKKPAFDLPAGFSIKPGFFQARTKTHDLGIGKK